MFLLGTIFCGGDMACSVTPNDADNINYIELKNGNYDDLYVTNNVADEPSAECPEKWDWDTILHATFDGNTNAGNMDWNLSTVSHILIKRKKPNEFKWKTIDVKEVHSIEDFNIVGFDYTNESQTKYQYAVVASLYGIEGNPSTVDVESRFDGIFIVEKDLIIGTSITDGFCDYTRNFPNSTIPTIHNKYPVDINTSIACYDSGTCGGNFVEMSEDCELKTEDAVRVPYQRELIDILSDRKPKLLKNMDGRIWLVKIETPVNDTAETVYNNRKITFTWTEIGDYKSEEDMYYAGLSDVTEEFWNV